MSISILIPILLTSLVILLILREDTKEIPQREDEKDYRANYAWLDEKYNQKGNWWGGKR